MNTNCYVNYLKLIHFNNNNKKKTNSGNLITAQRIQLRANVMVETQECNWFLALYFRRFDWLLCLRGPTPGLLASLHRNPTNILKIKALYLTLKAGLVSQDLILSVWGSLFYICSFVCTRKDTVHIGAKWLPPSFCHQIVWDPAWIHRK